MFGPGGAATLDAPQTARRHPRESAGTRVQRRDVMRRGSPRKSAREEARAEIEAYVLEAADRVLDKAGLAGFNVNAVAERAGVGIATLYRHFRSKDELLAHARARNLDMVHEATSGCDPDDTGTPLLRFGDRLIGTYLRSLQFRASRLGHVVGHVLPVAEGARRRARMKQAVALAAKQLDGRAGQLSVAPARREACAYIAPHLVAAAGDRTLAARPDWLGEHALRAEVVSLLAYRLLPAAHVRELYADPAPLPPSARGAMYADVRPTAPPRRQDARAREQAILAAAGALLEQKGLEVSMREVAGEARIQPGTLYGYFDSKASLVAEVLRRDAQTVADLLADLLANALSLPLRDVVRAMVGGLIAVHRAQPGFYRSALPIAGELGIGHDVAVAHDGMERSIRAALSQHAEVGIPPSAQPLAAFLLARVPATVVQSAVIDDALDMPGFEDELVEFTYRYIARS